MNNDELEKLKFPIGRFSNTPNFSAETKSQALSSVTNLPSSLRNTIEGWTEEQLDTPYREGGWTVRQLIHHIADSHINAFTRFKLGLTEDKPTIRPYNQSAWSDMQEEKTLSVEPSLNIVEGLHHRWSHILSTMTDSDYSRVIYHPEMEKELDLVFMTNMYAWHSNHHLAHIQNLKERKGW